MLDTIQQDKENRSEVERLRDENEALKARIKELETELKMYKAISSNKSF